MTAATVLDTLWYTRCPVPTPLGIAVQRGWFVEEFAQDGLTLQSLQDDANAGQSESHFDHVLPSSFRQGGNVPAIWARALGRATRVIGLSWTDEFQAIVALPGSGIAGVRDLKGRRFGLPVNPISIDFNRAAALRGLFKALELEGLTLADVERVDAVAAPGDGPGIASGEFDRVRGDHLYRGELDALLSGAVDAIYVKGVVGYETVRDIGATVVFDLGSHPDPHVRINNCTPRTLTVDQALIDARPDLVSRFLSRVVQAGQWAGTHAGETVDYIARETSATPDLVRAAYGRDVHRHLTTFLDDRSIAALGEFKDFLFSHGFLRSDFDVREWIDPRPLATLG